MEECKSSPLASNDADAATICATVEVEPSDEHVTKNEMEKSSAFQFSANLMKSITGSTSLIFPYTMWQMGLITGVSLTIVVVYVYCVSAWRLLEVKKQFDTEKKNENDSIYHLDNDYTILCYHYFGKFGYWLLLISTLITLWGSDMGTMVLMTDFLSALPFFKRIGKTKYIQRLLPAGILLILGWFTCILKNPTLLAGVSSLGLLALILAFVVLLVFGGMNRHISFDKSVLFPQSLLGILSTLGIIINAFGFMLVLFPLFNNMKKTAKPLVNKLVDMSLIVLSVIYILTGAILFLMFRNDKDGVQEAILMNLPGDSIAYYVVSITMVLTLLGSFPLLLLPCFQILESASVKRENSLIVTDGFRFWTRTIQVLVVSALAFFVPEFGSINAINILYLIPVGSLTGVIVSQLIPAALHLIVFKKSHGLWRFVEDIVILVLFFGVMIICTGSSVVDLIHKMKN